MYIVTFTAAVIFVIVLWSHGHHVDILRLLV